MEGILSKGLPPLVYSPKHPILEAFLVKNHPNHEKPILEKKGGQLSPYTFNMEFGIVSMIELLRIIL